MLCPSCVGGSFVERLALVWVRFGCVDVNYLGILCLFVLRILGGEVRLILGVGCILHLVPCIQQHVVWVWVDVVCGSGGRLDVVPRDVVGVREVLLQSRLILGVVFIDDLVGRSEERVPLPDVTLHSWVGLALEQLPPRSFYFLE